VDRAGVNRSTFYRHYLDKEDLLSRYMDDVTGVIFQNDEVDDPMEDQETIPSGLIKLLNHIQKFSEFYRIMLSTDGHPLVSERLRQKVENRFRIPVTEITKTQCKKGSVIELQLRSMSAAGIGAILWWVENNMPCTAEELADDEQVRRLYLGRNFELKRKDYLHDEARLEQIGDRCNHSRQRDSHQHKTAQVECMRSHFSI